MVDIGSCEEETANFVDEKNDGHTTVISLFGAEKLDIISETWLWFSEVDNEEIKLFVI